MEMTIRPRRLEKRSTASEDGAGDARWIASSLIYPMFVKEGDVADGGDPDDAGPVPLHVSIVHGASAGCAAGCRRRQPLCCLAFRITRMRWEAVRGHENGIIQKALRRIKKEYSGSSCMLSRMYACASIRLTVTAVCSAAHEVDNDT